MVDSNLQREQITPSEKAYAYIFFSFSYRNHTLLSTNLKWGISFDEYSLISSSTTTYSFIEGCSFKFADYDVIAVGTPTWWYTMAPAVKTFLHQQDFTGKTVVPFMTNGGWPGHVIKDMKAACKGANVVCDMQIQFDSTGGSNLETPQEQINEWIQSVKNLL